MAYFDSPGHEFALFRDSQIVKVDLDGDGRADYLVNALVEGSANVRRQESLLVLRQEGDGFEALSYIPTVTDPGLRLRRRIYTVDFDGDGLADVVDQRQYDIATEEAAFYA
ncbi:MAG: VCBS repeat-containing protein, partial [Thermoanaerobaculia bacterium]